MWRTRQIYEQFPDVADKDRVTDSLLEATFAALLANKLDLPAMVEAEPRVPLPPGDRAATRARDPQSDR